MTGRRTQAALHPVAWLRGNLEQAPLYPVAVLAGLNLFDELDNAAYGLFGPDITREFGISAATFGWAFVPAVVLGMILPIIMGYLTDRFNRVALAVTGGVVWFLFAVLTGLVGAFWLLVVVRMLTLVGRSVSWPVHNSLISDYYPVGGRGGAFSIHQNAQSLGSFIGLVAGGAIAAAWGWQVSFLILPLPGLVFVLLLPRLREPLRGKYERLVSGQAFDDSSPPSVAQSINLMRNAKSWRRYAFCWLFLAAGFAMTAVLSFYYEAVFGVGPFGRGVILGCVALLSVAGAVIGGVIAQRALAAGRGDRAGQLVTWACVASAVALVGVAVAPTLGSSVAVILFSTPLRALAAVPVLLILSATIPIRIRGQAFGVLGMYFSIGLLFLPIGLQYGDNYSYRLSLLLGAPAMLIAALFAKSAAKHINADIERANVVSASVLAVQERRAAGEEIDLLEISGLDVAYHDVQVLYGVDLRVREGEMVALLGTNGAGKSTLLRAMSGLVKPSGGMVLFDGEDVTGLDAEITTARGIVHVPGGRGVFPGLTVEKNLQLGTYLYRGDQDYAREALDRVLEMFPRLGERMRQPAGALSGGEQQMVTLAQAFMARPRIIAIDELSLGLAPRVVQELLDVVRTINATGVSVIVVEQSVNIALTLTQRAYFMEKGQVRFEGASSELLERDDLIRSVFLADPVRNTGAPS